MLAQTFTIHGTRENRPVVHLYSTVTLCKPGIEGTQKKAMRPSAVAGFSLDAEGAGCPGPALDP